MNNTTKIACVSIFAIFLTLPAAPSSACNSKGGKDCSSSVAHKTTKKYVGAKAPGRVGNVLQTGRLNPLGSAGHSAVAPVIYYVALPTGTMTMNIKPGSAQGLVNADGTLTAHAKAIGLQRVVGTPMAIPSLAPQNAPAVPTATPIVAPPLASSSVQATTPPPIIYHMGSMTLQIDHTTSPDLVNPDGTLTARGISMGLQSIVGSPILAPAQVQGQTPTPGAILVPGFAPSTAPKHVANGSTRHTNPDDPVAVYHPTGATTYRYEDANKIGDISFHLVVVGINDGIR